MIVIDASAMVDALVGEPANPELLALLADEELHAPALIDYEVVSVLRGHRLSGQLDDSHLARALNDFSDFVINRYPPLPMLQAMVDLRDNFTTYDAAYVVLAQALDAPLVSADAKHAEARRLGVDVQVIAPTQ